MVPTIHELDATANDLPGRSLRWLVDVAELLDAAMEGVRPLLESGALVWESSTPPPLADRRVKADSKRLRRAPSR